MSCWFKSAVVKFTIILKSDTSFTSLMSPLLLPQCCGLFFPFSVLFLALATAKYFPPWWFYLMHVKLFQSSTLHSMSCAQIFEFYLAGIEWFALLFPALPSLPTPSAPHLLSKFSHIKNPEGSLSHYVQTALQTTYLLYFLFFFHFSREAYLSLFVFLSRQPWFLSGSFPDALAGCPCNGKQAIMHRSCPLA